MPRTPSKLRPWLALAISIAAAVPAIFIVAPAPTRSLLPLGVGAPEVSAWLATIAVVALCLALLDIRQKNVARITAGIACLVIVASSVPFIRIHGLSDAADAQLRAAFGNPYLDRLPMAQRAQFRRAPLVVQDLFRGLGAPAAPVRITRGVNVARVAGVALTTDIYQPEASGSYPVLVQIYGGAWQRGSPDDFSEFAEHIAALGYVVFAIDYRHAPQFPFPAQVEDIRRDLAWIGSNAATWSADTSRMVLVGRSAGAHLAMLAAYATDAPHIRGVISFYGPVDLIEGYRQPPVPDPLDVRDVEEKFIGGTPDSLIGQYRAASPISLATRALPPTLLLYGGRDHIVDARFGATLAAQLRRVGTPVVHIELPQSEHAYDVIPNGPAGQLSRYVVERFLAAAVSLPR